MEEKPLLTKPVLAALICGAIGYLSFILHLFDHYLMFFIAPSIQLAYRLKGLLGWADTSFTVNNFLFLLPITILYHFLAGFLFDKVCDERGGIRHFTLVCYIFFILTVHYTAWADILKYLS